MNRHMGITSKLTLVFVFFAAGMLAVVNLLVYESGKSTLQNATASMLLSESIEKQAALDTWITEKQNDIGILAANLDFTGHLESHLTNSDTGDLLIKHNTEVEYLKKWAGTGKGILSLMVLNPISGQVIMATDPRDLGKYKESNPYYIEGSRGPFVQEFFYSMDQGGVAIVASAPVHSISGQLVGVLAAYLNLNEANQIIQRRTAIYQTDEAFLVNTSNLFVTQPRLVSDAAVLQRGIHTEAVNLCLQHKNGVKYYPDYRDVPVIAAYRWLPEHQLCLIVKIDQAEAYAPVNTLGRNILIISVLALLIASVLAYALAKTITRPVLGMQAAAARFATGELDVRLPQTADDELGTLAIAFNKMAEELKIMIGSLEERVAERTADLRASEEQYRALFDNAAVGMYRLCFEDNKILALNQKLADLFGCTEEEMLHNPAAMRWANLQAGTDLYARLLERGELSDYEIDIVRKDGEVRTVLVSMRLYPSGGYLEGSVVDITERKHNEERIQKLNQDLKRSNKELEQFAYVASHDLQEPLRMVSSYTQMLGRRYQGKLDQDADDFIGFAVDGANRMQRLINDLLKYSRVNTHDFIFEPVDCNEAFDQVCLNLSRMIEENRAILTKDELPVVHADGSQMVQLFQNLIANAVKFHAENDPRVHVSAKKEGDEWVFSVCDNGIGIEPEYHERIFVIFQRLHEREKYPGTGIGLAIVKRIVERHGGRIWLESQPGKGTTFYFTIPNKSPKNPDDISEPLN